MAHSLEPRGLIELQPWLAVVRTIQQSPRRDFALWCAIMGCMAKGEKRVGGCVCWRGGGCDGNVTCLTVIIRLLMLIYRFGNEIVCRTPSDLSRWALSLWERRRQTGEGKCSKANRRRLPAV